VDIVVVVAVAVQVLLMLLLLLLLLLLMFSALTNTFVLLFLPYCATLIFRPVLPMLTTA
jgi:hypothetical protein